MMKKTLMFCVTTVIAFETESAMSPGWEGSRHSDNDTLRVLSTGTWL